MDGLDISNILWNGIRIVYIHEKILDVTETKSLILQNL